MRLRFFIRVKHEPALPGASASVERPVDVLAEDAIVIGRRPGVAIQLPFETVSAEHARLVRSGRGWTVEDLGSANGTFAGDRRMVARIPEPVAPGEVIRVGCVEVRFGGEIGAQDVSGSSGTATLARRLVHDVFEVLPPAERPRLVVVAGPAAGRELVLPDGGRTMRLGRGDGCDWVIPDHDISREHASFERSPDGVVLRDLGSKNGVRVGDAAVSGPQTLHDGDTVVLGGTRLQVIDPEERYLRQMEQISAASAACAAPKLVAPARPSRLPAVATTIAATTLLLCLALVLALIFLAKA